MLLETEVRFKDAYPSKPHIIDELRESSMLHYESGDGLWLNYQGKLCSAGFVCNEDSKIVTVSMSRHNSYTGIMLLYLLAKLGGEFDGPSLPSWCPMKWKEKRWSQRLQI